MLTHNHFDHILGSSAFVGAEIQCASAVAATMAASKRGQDRQQRHADTGGKPPTRAVSGRFAGRVEVQACGVDGGQNGNGVVGEVVSGRRQPYPASVRLDQLRSGFSWPAPRSAGTPSKW